MKIYGLIWLFLILTCPIFVSGQTNGKVSLIVKECQNYVPDVWCEPMSSETVAYHFENGILKNREVLMTGDKFPFEFRFPSDTEYVHQNRYLISDDGDVYDFKQRKIIFRNNGGGLLSETPTETVQNLGLVKAIGERVFVRLAVSNAEATNRAGFFAYNLRTNKFNKLRDIGDFPKLEAKNFSDNNKMIAVIEKMKLVFYAVDAKFNFRKLRTVNLGFAVPADKYDDNSEEMSVVWVDKQSILTQNKAGEIVKINLNGNISKLLKPKKIESEGKPAEISKDSFGNFLLFPCNIRGKQCLIDLPTRKVKEIDCPSLGNKFQAKMEKQKSDPNFWQYDFSYENKAIGKNRGCFNAKTINGYLAIEYADRNEKTANINVWNTVKKDWTNIKIKWHPQNIIVGWIR